MTNYFSFHHALHTWYQAHGRRELPWRNTDDPYTIWVSEIMLQQTQVKTVLERFYHPFLTAFPTVHALAEAPESAVMKQWEGLGYYMRARNLHACARQIVREHNGRFPDDPKALERLPGIGKNTAHAIAAFAYHVPVPVMEANLKRVLSRIFAIRDVSSASGIKQLWNRAHKLLDQDNPFDYNQAMMDIGATICTKSRPLCTDCPANSVCKGKDDPEAYPAPKRKKPTPVRERVILVITNAEGAYYLYKRTTRFLGGLYGFPEMEIADGLALLEDVTHRDLGHITQTYSHFQLQAELYLVDYAALSEKAPDLPPGDWYAKDAIVELPLSTADIKVSALL